MSNSQMWVYKVDPVPYGEEILNTYSKEMTESMMRENAQRNERLINQRAAEGWELAFVGNSNFYFKRPK